MTYHFISIRLGKIRKLGNASTGQDADKQEPSCTTSSHINYLVPLFYDPELPLLVKCPEELTQVHKDVQEYICDARKAT